MIFVKVGRVLTTILTDQAYVQVLIPLVILGESLGRQDGAWRQDLCHLCQRLSSRRFANSVTSVQSARDLPPCQLLALATGLMLLGETADEELGIRFGGGMR